MEAIEAARQTAVAEFDASQQPEQEQEPDSGEQLVSALAPMLQTIAQVMDGTSQALASISQGQQAMIEEMAQDREQGQMIMTEVMRPKQSSVKVVKQSDGSFVGQKTEQ